MKRNFLKIETCKCSMCEVTQTAFIYVYDENDKEVDKVLYGTSPTFELGFTCVKKDCETVTKGVAYYEASGATVGDVKKNL